MSVEQETIVDTSPEPVEPTPEPVEPTPTPDPEPTLGDDDGDDTPAPEPVEYAPNTKFNVRNEEHNFDDWVVPLIKDEETEKKVRELYEKARGIDHVKKDRQVYKETNAKLNQEIEENYKPAVQHTQALNYFLQNGDLGSFFHYSGLKPQEVLKWSIGYAQLPPEQRIGADQNAMNNINTVQQNFQQTDQNYQQQQQLVEYRHKEVDWIIQRPDVSHVQQAFDAQNGEGAFKKEVINRGIMLQNQNKADVPAEQVIRECVQIFGPAYSQNNPQSQMQQQNPINPQMNQPPQMQTQSPAANPPVITNIQSRGTSPAKKKMKSLADWDKKIAELD